MPTAVLQRAREWRWVEGKAAHPLLSTAFVAYSIWNTFPSGLYVVLLRS